MAGLLSSLKSKSRNWNFYSEMSARILYINFNFNSSVFNRNNYHFVNEIIGILVLTAPHIALALLATADYAHFIDSKKCWKKSQLQVGYKAVSSWTWVMHFFGTFRVTRYIVKELKSIIQEIEFFSFSQMHSKFLLDWEKSSLFIVWENAPSEERQTVIIAWDFVDG